MNVQPIFSARNMEVLDRGSYNNLEQVTRDPIAQQVKAQKAVINSLIEAMVESHDVALKAASTSGEPDKILAVCRILTEAIASAAKV